MDFRDVGWDRLILDGFDSRGVGNSSFVSTEVSKNISTGNSDECLLSTEHGSVTLNSLDDLMNCLKVLPNKSTNSGVLWNGLVDSVRELVLRLRTFDWNIVGEGLSPVRDLWVKDMGNVSLENSQRVSPTHGKYCEMEGAERSVIGSHVSGVLVELTLVKGNIEVESSVDKSSGEVFGNNVSIWRHSSVADCNSIQRLQRVYET